MATYISTDKTLLNVLKENFQNIKKEIGEIQQQVLKTIKIASENFEYLRETIDIIEDQKIVLENVEFLKSAKSLKDNIEKTVEKIEKKLNDLKDFEQKLEGIAQDIKRNNEMTVRNHELYEQIVNDPQTTNETSLINFKIIEDVLKKQSTELNQSINDINSQVKNCKTELDALEKQNSACDRVKHSVSLSLINCFFSENNV